MIGQVLSIGRILREHYLLFASALALVTSTPFVTEMLIRAWESPGRLRESVHGLGEFLRVGFDVVVVFPTGLYIGLLVLFLLDESKKIQAILASLITVIIAIVLVSGGHWVQDINWTANAHWGILGFILALPIGGFVHYLRLEVPREFPRASGVILTTFVIATIVGFVEAHLRYAGEEAFSVAVVNLPRDLVVSIVFVGTLGYFLSYSYRQDVFVFSTSDRIKTQFMAELFHYTRLNRKAREWGRYSRDLNRAVTALQRSDEVTAIRGDLRLRFKTENVFAMWISVVTDGSKIERLSESNVSQLEEIYGQRSRGLSIRRRIDSVLGSFVRFDGTPRGVIDLIDRADVILLLFDTNKVLAADDPGRTQMETYDRIQHAVSSQKRVVLVAMNAAAGLDAFEESSFPSREKGLSSREFRIFLQKNLFGGPGTQRQNAIDPADIVPVNRFEDEQFADGIEEIVEKLEP
jgi:hypothetical protein